MLNYQRVLLQGVTFGPENVKIEVILLGILR